MRILFVAMPFSIHTVRWISQLSDTGWDIHLFPSMKFQSLHAEMRGVVYHENFYNNLYEGVPGNAYSSLHMPYLSFIKNGLIKRGIRKFADLTGMEKDPASELAAVIKKIRPDIIHSLETQHAGYLVTQAKKQIAGEFPFPVWIHSNWGIDLHFFGRLQKHIPLIRETLGGVNLLLVEGKRDEVLARELGYQSKVHVFPSVGGGFLIPDRKPDKTSLRKKILVKGTQDIIRRGVVALRALERCIDLLSEYEIILYSSNEITRAVAELFTGRTGKQITILEGVDHAGMLRLNAEARINLCVNISDGLPNAMLEAMLMGAFPIQSDTSLADEWIRHGETGMLVPPEDPDIIETAIREALLNDELVDLAAIANRQRISEQLEYEDIKASVTDMYRSAVFSS